MQQLQEAIRTLWTARLNIELLMLSDADGDPYFNMRARPWKNSPNAEFMILVGAHSLDDCLVLVAEGYERDQWKRLDWTRRVLPPASPPHNVRQFPTSDAPGALDDPHNRSFLPKRYDPSSEGDERS